jgi:RNA polymerase sigma-70 factor (ECF subfamily)
MKLSYGNLFQDWEVGIVKKIVSEYRRKWKCLERDGFDDLVQECLIHWLDVRDKYNPNKDAAIQTFMARVIRNRLSDLVKEGSREKRKAFYQSRSLYELTDDIASSGKNIIDDFIAEELNSKVLNVFEKLTLDQRKLCELLLEEDMNINKASRYFQKHRSCIYDDVKKLRDLFEKEGLRDYLK